MKKSLRKALALATGVVMVLGMSVSAFAATYPTEAVATSYKGQFYKVDSNNNPENEVSMTQKALVNDYVRVVAKDSTKTVISEANGNTGATVAYYDVYLPTQGFSHTVGIITGYGYLNSVEVDLGSNSVTGTVTEDSGATNHEGTLKFPDVAVSDYNSLIAAVYSDCKYCELDYTLTIFNYNHNSHRAAAFGLMTNITPYTAVEDEEF